MNSQPIYNEELTEAMSAYHEYVLHIISNIIDFDIWYEQSNGKDFPKEWYTFIRNANKDFKVE